MKTETTKNNSPLKTFRAGQIKATVWAKQMDIKTKDGNKEITVYTTTVDKSYKKDDKWMTTNGFNRDELPKVAAVTQKAYEFIIFMANVDEDD
jgi:hypothetical protein